MVIQKIFSRETRDTVVSKRFLLYLALIFLPVIVGAGFSYLVYRDPSTLATMSSMLPEPITEVTPAICMMIYMDCAILPALLVAIIHAADFIAGEQTRGTLLLLLSKPVPRWQLLAGKYLSFLVVFAPMVFLSVGLMALSLPLIGVGGVSGNVFLGYFIYLLAMGLVYISIATLFSAITNKTVTAILGSFILMVVWIMFDFIIIYLPERAADILNIFSLSHYANNLLGYISGGTASLFVTGGVAQEVLFADYMQAWGAIAMLILIPLAASLVVLYRKELYG